MNSQEAFLLAQMIALRSKRGIKRPPKVKLVVPKPPAIPGVLRNRECICGSGMKSKNCNCTNYSR